MSPSGGTTGHFVLKGAARPIAREGRLVDANLVDQKTDMTAVKTDLAAIKRSRTEQRWLTGILMAGVLAVVLKMFIL